MRYPRNIYFGNAFSNKWCVFSIIKIYILYTQNTLPGQKFYTDFHNFKKGKYTQEFITRNNNFAFNNKKYNIGYIFI